MGKTFLNRLGLVIAITAFAAVAGEAAAQTGNRHIVEVGEARTTVTVKVWLPVEPITFHPHALAGRWKGLPAKLPDVISHHIRYRQLRARQAVLASNKRTLPRSATGGKRTSSSCRAGTRPAGTGAEAKRATANRSRGRP